MIASGSGGQTGSVVQALIGIGFGITVLTIGLRPLLRGLASRHWTVTQGTVLSTELKWTGKAHALFMTYAYRVNDREYTGRRYRISQFGRGAVVIPDMRTDWLGGEPIAVYYDPGRPELATIETGIRPRGAVFELLVVAWGACYLLWAVTMAWPLVSQGLGH